MLSLPDAQTLIRAEAPSLTPEILPLTEAAGRILAAEVRAAIAMPRFANTGMDGIALNSAEVAEATLAEPVPLLNLGRILAGDGPGAQLTMEGACFQVMTGAPLPEGADAVIPVEQLQIEGDRVWVSAPAQPGFAFRPAGEDFGQGQVLLPPGVGLGPVQRMVLMSAGIRAVPVWPRLRLGFVSTGPEVVAEPGAPLGPGQIYNSSRLFLAQWSAAALGVEAVDYGAVPDEPAALQAVAERMQAEGCAIMVSTGAVSAGVADFVAGALTAMGAEILLHQIRLRPGKPNLFARMPGGGVWFGLPGNPVSTVAGLRFLVGEYLRASRHQGREIPLMLPLLDPVTSPKGLTQYLKARLSLDLQHRLGVTVLPGQASHLIRPMLDQTVWALVPEDVAVMSPGEEVACYPMLPESFPGEHLLGLQ